MLLKKDIEKSFNIRNKKKLFIFELANNHNGSIDNGFILIRSAKKISKSSNINFAIKLQFRDLKSFLYKKNRIKNKHIERFKSAKLSENEYSKLCKYIKKNTLVKLAIKERQIPKSHVWHGDSESLHRYLGSLTNNTNEMPKRAGRVVKRQGPFCQGTKDVLVSCNNTAHKHRRKDQKTKGSTNSQFRKGEEPLGVSKMLCPLF